MTRTAAQYTQYSSMVAALLLATLLLALPAHAQRNRRKKQNPAPTLTYNDSLYQALTWRNIGPFRGGRVTAVAGLPHNTQTYFMGGTGGGVWKTTDAGNTWRNVSDGHFNTGSVGAIAVAPSDPNVLYVGMGEAPVRGVMTSHGDGVYRSSDGGQTWTHLGLEKTRHISRIHVHPTNPNVLWVAAQGSPYAPTPDRGVYKSTNGGQTWAKTLFVDELAGISDLSLDPTNHRILYAAVWQHQRLPWQVVSGGPNSGIYKSTDGGDTWEPLKNGLPKATMGKIGIAASPAQPGLVWAIIESEKGGLYKSVDGGAHWKLINANRVLRARSWYYMHVFAHPQDPQTVFVLNAPVMRSTDGGKTFAPLATPHGDNHALWINPQQPHIMINGNDGGANISFNNGVSWSTQRNQPTAQFYRVTADNQYPYRVYGGQQDNSSVSLASAADGMGIGWGEFYSVGGCESAYTGFDPNDPSVIYAGCYQGIITEWNQATRRTRDVMAYPNQKLGTKPADQKYRFNWNAPIIVSQHDSKVIYHAANKLLRSTDAAVTWEEISPDLTRNDSTHLSWGGGPITREGAGGEVYHTIMYVAESPHDDQVLWVGSDDGLVHVTTNGGGSWQPVSLPGISESIINSIEVSPHDGNTVYVVANRYKFNDFAPHIYKTTNGGASFQEVVSGLPAEAHVRVVREDPARKGLLYAGTELGLFISFDGGNSWKPFQGNLPIVPITDLKVHQGDLIAATQGRAFWVLDDLSPLHQLSETVAQAPLHLFAPRPAHLANGVRIDSLPTLGTNPDNGVMLFYTLKGIPAEKKADTVALSLEILDAQGQVLRTYASNKKKPQEKLPKKNGMNKLVWDMRLPAFEAPKGLLVWQGLAGHKVGPGNYQARLVYGADTLTQPITIKPDPRVHAVEADYQLQQTLLTEVRGHLTALYQTVNDMRSVKGQLKQYTQRMGQDESAEDLVAQADSMVSVIDSLEQLLVQPKQKTFQDVINYPNMLDAAMLHIMNSIQGTHPKITTGQRQRVKDVVAQWQEIMASIDQLMTQTLPEFNAALAAKAVPHIAPMPKKKE